MKKALFLFLSLMCCLMFTIPIYGQGGSFSDTIFGPSILIKPGAFITVCTNGSTVSSCPSNKIVLYSDVTLTTPVTNPTITDANGRFTIFASPGTYNYIVTGTGITPQTTPFVFTVGCAPGSVLSTCAGSGAPLTAAKVGVGSVGNLLSSIAGFQFDSASVPTTLSLPYKLNVTLPGIFTNMQYNSSIYSLVNGCDPATQFSYAQGGATVYSSDGITSCVIVPNTSATINATAFSGYIQNNSTVSNAVGGYFQATCWVAGVCWGTNPYVSDRTGVSGATVLGIEDDVEIFNTSTMGNGMILTGNAHVNNTNISGIQIQHGIGTYPVYLLGLQVSNGATTSGTGIVLGTQSVSGANSYSQSISMSGRDVTNTSHTAQIQSDPNGDVVVTNSTGYMHSGAYALLNGTGFFGPTGLLLQSPTIATALTNYSCPGSIINGGSFWNGTAGGPDNWGFSCTLGTGTNPTSTFTLSHTGSSGTTNFNVQTNNVQFSALNGSGTRCLHVDGTGNIGPAASDCVTGTAGSTITVNGGATLPSPVNIQNGPPYQGITINAINPSLGNVDFQLAGTLADAGLTSAYSGVGACASHTWASTLTRNAAATCTQPTLADIAAGVAPAGTFDFSGVTLMKLRVGAGATSSANGDEVYDSTAKNWHIWGNAVDNFVAVFPVSAPPTNSHCVNWTVTGGVYTLGDAGGTCSTGSTATWGSITNGTNSNAGTFSATGNSWDFTGATIFKLRVGAGATSSANGDMVYDTTSKNWHLWANGADELLAPLASTPTTGDCAKFTVAASVITLADFGAGCGGTPPTIQTNTVNNTTQTLLNFLPSTTNAVGLTITPSNPSGGVEKLEITGASYTGNAATATALASAPTNCATGVPTIGIAASGNSNGCITNLANGTAATTQTTGDNTTKLATDAFVLANSFTNPMTTLGDVIYGGASGAATRLAGPTTPNGVPQSLIDIPIGSAAVAETWALPGITTRAITGTTSTDTIASTDCSPKRVSYQGTVAVATSLPTPTTLAVANCIVRVANNSSATVTFTPAGGLTINGASTLPLLQGQVGTIFVDPSGSWDADISEQGITAGTNITLTRGAYGLTASATGGSAVAAGTCTMTTTTCTATLTSTVTSPICTVTDKSHTYTGQCSVSGTTVTVTSGTSNTDVWNIMVAPASGFGSGGGATYTYVGTAKNAVGAFSSVTPLNISYSATAGNLLVVDYFFGASGTLSGATYKATDNNSDTFSTAYNDTTSVGGGQNFGEYYLCVASSGITTVGLSATGGTGNVEANAIVREYSYTGGTCSLDQVSSVGTGTGTTFTAGSITPTVSNSLVSTFFHQNVSQACSASGAFTARNDIGDGADGLCTLDDIVSSNATLSGTAAVSGSASYYGYTVNYK